MRGAAFPVMLNGLMLLLLMMMLMLLIMLPVLIGSLPRAEWCWRCNKKGL